MRHYVLVTQYDHEGESVEGVYTDLALAIEASKPVAVHIDQSYSTLLVYEYESHNVESKRIAVHSWVPPTTITASYWVTRKERA